MKIRQRIKRNNFILNIATTLAAFSMTAYSFADNDYERIRKDINVMADIVKSAFKNSDTCRNCNVKISGHYLADQGVVFNIDPTRTHFAFAPEADVQVVTRGIVEGIPGMVHELLDEVQINIDDAEHSWAWSTDGDFDIHDHSAREVRNELREARREMRERSRELRELAIQSIHADDEELKNIREQEAKIEADIQEIEQRQAAIEERISNEAEKRIRVRKERREAKLEKERERIEEIENIALNAFCDYSSTLRSVPRNEKVSLIVHQGRSSSNIFVFEQSKLENCDSTKTDVRGKALSYIF